MEERIQKIVEETLYQEWITLGSKEFASKYQQYIKFIAFFKKNIPPSKIALIHTKKQFNSLTKVINKFGEFNNPYKTLRDNQY